MMGSMVGQGMVELLPDAGMDLTIASFTKIRGNVMYAAIWRRLPLSLPNTLIRNMQYMNKMFISQLP